MSHWSRLFCCAHSSAPFNQMAADPGFCLNKQFAENRSQLHSHRWCGVTCWLFLAFINPSPFQLSPILCALVVRLAFIFCPRPNNVNYCWFDQQRAASFLYFANSLCLTKARTNNYPIYKTWRSKDSLSKLSFLYESQIGIVASTNYSVCCSK